MNDTEKQAALSAMDKQTAVFDTAADAIASIQKAGLFNFSSIVSSGVSDCLYYATAKEGYRVYLFVLSPQAVESELIQTFQKIGKQGKSRVLFVIYRDKDIEDFLVTGELFGKNYPNSTLVWGVKEDGGEGIAAFPAKMLAQAKDIADAFVKSTNQTRH